MQILHYSKKVTLHEIDTALISRHYWNGALKCATLISIIMILNSGSTSDSFSFT